MPYVTQKRRAELDPVVQLMAKVDVKADGDLNYILFAYARYGIKHSYNSLKNYIGELNETTAEIRRRILAPYEDTKIKENGDV